MCQVWHSISNKTPPRPFRTLQSKYADQAVRVTSGAAPPGLEDAFNDSELKECPSRICRSFDRSFHLRFEPKDSNTETGGDSRTLADSSHA